MLRALQSPFGGFFVALTALFCLALGARPVGAANPNVNTIWPPGTIAYIPCGASINSYTASVANGGNGTYGNGSGVTFQLAGSPDRPCVYAGQTFHTQSNETIQGDCSSSLGRNTILNGGDGAPSAGVHLLTFGGPTAFGGDGSTGVTIQCLTIMNYGGAKQCTPASLSGCGAASGAPACTATPPYCENWSSELDPWNGWVLQNLTLRDSGGDGVILVGSSTLRNSLVTGNFHSGVACQTGWTSNDGGPIQIIGNEISFNNQRNDNIFLDVGDKCSYRADLAGANQTISAIYNYVHDNYSPGLWCDGECSPNYLVEWNTIIHNQGQGIRCEVSNGCVIAHNVLVSMATTQQSGNLAIACSNAPNCQVHDNMIMVPNGGSGIDVDAICRNDNQPNPNGAIIQRNTVAFAAASPTPPYSIGNLGLQGLYDNTHGSWGANICGTTTPPTPVVSSFTSNIFLQNHYFSPALADQHWIWGSNDTWCSLAQLQGGTCSSASVPYTIPANTIEPNSVVNAGTIPTPTGCRQIGCSSDPVPQQSLVGLNPAGSITGVLGATWTVVGGQIYNNNIVDPATSNVVLLLYYADNIYQQTASGNWYQLTKASWPAGASGYTQIAGDPRLDVHPASAGSITWAYDNARNSLGAPADVAASVSFTASVVKGAKTAPRRAVAFNIGLNPIPIATVAFTGTNATDFSIISGANSCSGSLAVGGYCYVWFYETPSGNAAESAVLTLTDIGGNSYALPVSGVAATTLPIVSATCSSINGATLAANTLYQLPAGTCSGDTFHTSNGTILQGDCTAPEGTNTILDGGSTTGLLTNGVWNGDSTSNVVIECLTIQNYAYNGTACHATGTLANNTPQLDIWTGWLIQNTTIQDSCGTGIGVFSTGTLQFSRVTANSYQGASLNSGGVNGAAGNQSLISDEFDHNSNLLTTPNCTDVSSCGAFKADYRNDLGTYTAQPFVVSGLYSHDNTGPSSEANGAWCDIGCGSFTVTGSTILNNGGDGIRYELTYGQSGYPAASGTITHNVVVGNGAWTGAQGYIVADCGDNLTADWNYVSETVNTIGGILAGPDSRCPSHTWHFEASHNVIVMTTAGGFGGGWRYGLGSIDGTNGTVGSLSSNNNAFYTGGLAISAGLFRNTPASNVNLAFSAWQTAGFDPASTISTGLPIGAPSGCTGDGTYGIGCVGSGM